MPNGRRESDYIPRSECEQRGEFCEKLHAATQEHVEDKFNTIEESVKEVKDDAKGNRKLLIGILITGMFSSFSIVAAVLMIILKPILIEALSKHASITIKLLGFFSGII